MRKLKRFWLDLPRKRRAAINFLLTLLFSLGLYILLGCPPFTPEQQFRRVEKANLVGPAMILGTEEISHAGNYQLIVAEEKDAVILYSFSADYPEDDTFVYRKKAGDTTVLAVSTNQVSWYYDDEAALNLVVFDEFPQAVRAELDFSLSAVVNDLPFEKDYSLSADRRNEGYFLFRYGVSGSPHVGPEGAALHAFKEISGNNGDTYIDVAVPVTVRFYTESDTLIAERSLTIRSQAAEAHPDIAN